MALIQCPYCGDEISDRAQVCPHCNRDLTYSTGWQRCSECGAVLSGGESVCHSCGCPTGVQQTEQTYPAEVPEKTAAPKRTMVYLLVLAVIAAAVFGVYKSHQSHVYYGAMDEINDILAKGIEELNYTADQLRLVGFNAVFSVYSEETDGYTCPDGQFVTLPEALENLYAEPEFHRHLTKLSVYTDELRQLRKQVKGLTLIPREWQEYTEYELELVDVFMEGSMLVCNPRGTFLQLTLDIRDMFDRWNSLVEKIDLLDVW